jgi:hypothetical protein
MFVKRGNRVGWVVEMGQQEPRVNNIEDSAHVHIHGSCVEQPKLHVAKPLRIRFAASDVELRCINLHADGLAARAYVSGNLQGDITTAAPHIEAPLLLAGGEAIKQGRRGRIHDAGKYP